jgi:nucleotide-binding universal stress UspA family protein
LVIRLIFLLPAFGQFYMYLKLIIMKTIGVLVDFSARSEHAARYALQLAKSIHADLLLFNAFLAPSDIPMAAAQVAWPLPEYEEIKGGSEESLQAFCNRLKHGLKDRPAPGAFLPGVTCQCAEGPLVDALAALEHRRDIVLLVAGTHGAGAVTTFMLGNNCRELIDKTTWPLLLVPENTKSGSPENILFATDLHRNDIQYINAVAGLAEKFTADLGIINVIPENGGDKQHRLDENAFMQEMVLKVRYRRVSFRNRHNQSVIKGITQLLLDEKPNLLVMVHRKSSFFDSFLKPSVTQNIASKTAVPLLIYPYPMPVVPAF